VMQLLHVLLASAVVWVVATFAPMPRWTRVLIVLGYWLGFEYAVISRNYALGLLPLFASAALLQHRPKAYIGQGVLLAVACQANALAMMLAGCLGLLQIDLWLRDGRPMTRRFLIGAIILAAGVLLSVAQLWPVEDRAYSKSPKLVDVERAGRIAAAWWQSFVPIPPVGRHWWGNNLLDITIHRGGILKFAQPVLGVITFAVVAWSMPRRREGLGLFLLGTGVLCLFFYVVFPGGLRHQGHLVIAAVLALWIGGGWNVLSKTGRFIWTALFGVSAGVGLLASALDTVQPFSASRALATHIEANYPPASPVIGTVDLAVSPIAGPLERPIWYPTPGRFGTFIKWDNRRSTWADLQLIEQRAARFHTELSSDVPVLLVLSELSNVEPSSVFREVARFENATVADERYRLFVYVPERGGVEDDR
ncbi:MAG: hypothetical protein AAGK78_01920, partial [Planctomycetota bacterium]